MMTSDGRIQAERRKTEKTYEFRKRIDFVYLYIRSCAVCTTTLPPVDLLCGVCWRELGDVMNRGAKVRQGAYPFPVYSLMTWTPQTESFVKPLIYGFKGGRTIRASEKLASLFLSERFSEGPSRSKGAESQHDFAAQPNSPMILSAPSSRFDHSTLWGQTLATLTGGSVTSPFRELTKRSVSQKQLNQHERADRRYELREHFAGSLGSSSVDKSIATAEKPARHWAETHRIRRRRNYIGFNRDGRLHGVRRSRSIRSLDARLEATACGQISRLLECRQSK